MDTSISWEAVPGSRMKAPQQVMLAPGWFPHPSLCHKIDAIFYLDNLISLEENIRQCPVAR